MFTPGVATKLTVGVTFTVTVVTAVFVQPFASVPVTVYVVVALAENGTLFITPPVHVYVAAPVPLSVTIVPEHTSGEGFVVVATVGNGFTVMVAVAVDVHPFGAVPVTV